jgi:hypothetical protein
MDELIVKGIAGLGLALLLVVAAAYRYRDHWGLRRRVHRQKGEGPYRAGDLTSYRMAGAPRRIFWTAIVCVSWAPVVFVGSLASSSAALGVNPAAPHPFPLLGGLAGALAAAGCATAFLYALGGLVLVDRQLTDVSLQFARVGRVYFGTMAVLWALSLPVLEWVALLLLAFAVASFAVATLLRSAARAAIAYVPDAPAS